MGAAPLADYVGGKIAKSRAPKGQKKYVKQTTTARQARNSGIRLAANVASLAAGGAAAGVVRGASKARKAAKVVPKKIKVTGQKKAVKVKNPMGATNVPRKTRKVKFKIKKYR